MNDNAPIVAQVVMRREDGRSILDLEKPALADSPTLREGDLPADRIERIRAMLTAAGFAVEAGSANTLSVSGPAALFEEVFGIDPGAAEATRSEAHATRIRPDLAPFVADVFVPPPPEFFP